MTIDERIEKLTERHEALAQSVELFHADMRHLTQTVDSLGTKVDTMADTMSLMIQALKIHDRRIGDLEATN